MIYVLNFYFGNVYHFLYHLIAEYFLMHKNQLCNEVGANLVTDLNLCKAAVENIKNYMPDIDFGSKSRSSRYPQGCYLHNNKYVYLNPHQDGSKSYKAKQICRKSNGKINQRQ